ncbi:MAG: molybdenum cofactor biosynthesis protein MoaE [Actinomycetota bacterium]
MSTPKTIEILVTTQSLQGFAAGIGSNSDGAVVSFNGIVRDSTDDLAVEALEYEAHTQMAELQMREIAETALRQWEISQVAIGHRTGRLVAGECSVVVIVCAPHREAAFQACQYCIDTLKAKVAIWKKEIFADGASRWVDHP